MHRVAALLCLVIFFSQPSRADDPDIERGVRQIEEGDLHDAVITLERVARRLENQAGSPAERARAWLHLGIAHLGLANEAQAEDAFRAALAAEPSLTVNPNLYSRQVVHVFERVSAHLSQPGDAPARGGSRRWPWVLGVGAAAGGAVAVSAGGERPNQAPLADPRSVDDDGDGFTEAQGDCNDSRPEIRPDGPVTVSPVTSPEAGQTIRCTQPVTARITLTNLSCRIVEVTGIHRTSRGLAGGCNPAPPFTYRPIVNGVQPGQTVAIFDRALFSSGSGCCFTPNCDAGTCRLAKSFVVSTSVGDLDAGSFTYSTIFRNCHICSSATFGDLAACAPAR